MVADVSGKGLPAALFASAIKFYVAALESTDHTLDETLSMVNEGLFQDCAPNLFCTLFAASFDHETKVLQFASAGHNKMFLKKGNEVQELSAREGLPLGVIEGAKYSLESVKIDSGDVLFLYTDGCSELFAPDGEMYGIDRLVTFLKTSGANGANAMNEDLHRELSAFRGEVEAPDDQTTLLVKFS